MRAADTNVVVRLIVRDDARQVAAAEAFIASGAWVSHLALVEAVWVFKTVYEFSAAKIVEAVGMLVQHESLILQEPDVVLAAVELHRSRPAVGFSDCMILELARKAGHGPVGTFDRALAKLPGAAGL